VLGHDLRNPLGAIMMSATMMMRKEGPDWPHQRTASQILSSGVRMDRMIGDLVDFTRTRLGKGIPIIRKHGDLEAICRDAVDELAAFHPDAIVRFEATGDLSGEWDGGRLGQALSNLIGNAYEHGASGEAIDVAARGDNDGVIVTVHNIGPTIPKGADIFSPFRQGESLPAKSRATRSLGLGLYIAHAIAAAHEGSLVVDSANNHTTFTLRLPRRAVTPAASE
jgi:signal transduction histidine kinase